MTREGGAEAAADAPRTRDEVGPDAGGVVAGGTGGGEHDGGAVMPHRP